MYIGCTFVMFTLVCSGKMKTDIFEQGRVLISMPMNRPEGNVVSAEVVQLLALHARKDDTSKLQVLWNLYKQFCRA